LAIALTTLLLFTACGSPSTTSDDEKVVSIGWLADLTGPASAASQYPHNVLVDFMRYANEEELIPGVTIKLLWVDTHHDTALELSGYRRFLGAGAPIVTGIFDPDYFKKILAKDEVPMITLAVTAESIYPPGWIYTIYPTWAESFAVWCQWVMDNWKEDRPPRIALMGPDTLAGPPAIEPATPYVESLGIEMLPSEFVPWVPLDTTPQLLRLKERGADYVYLCPIWTTALPVLKDAQRLGLKDTIRFAGVENTQAQGMLQALGHDAEGYTVPRTCPWWEETDIPGIQLMQDLRRKYGGRFDFAGDEANGIVAGAVTIEAIKNAIEDVGYENLDGRAVRKGLDNIKNLEPYGLRVITYTPEDHRGSSNIAVYQVVNGQVVRVSDWLVAPIIAP